MKGFILPSLVLSLLLSLTAAAQPAGQKPVVLKKIVVSATKTEKEVSEVPGSVTVIDKEELEKKEIETVDDALNSIPGVFVKRTKGLMDSTTSVRLRGFGGDQYTLVLLDGQPLNDAYTGGLDWGNISVGNIERIEVVRGAASALYGGNAMGGVINIITRTPKKAEMEVSGGYGTNDTWRYRVIAGNRFRDRLGIQVGFEQEGTDGYATTPVVKTLSSGSGNVEGGYAMNDKYGSPGRWVIGDKGRNGAERLAFHGKVSYDISDTGQLAFTVVSGKNEYDYGRPTTLMGTYGDGTTYAIGGDGLRSKFAANDFINYTGIGKNRTDTFSLSFREMLGEVQLNAQVGTNQVDDRYTLESGSGLQDFDDSPGTLKITENSSWFSEVSANMPLGADHVLTLGTSFRADQSDTDDFDIPFYRSYSGSGESTFYSGGNSRTWAGFAQDEWQVADPLVIYLGARYDAWKVYDGASGAPGDTLFYESNTESRFSPKVAAVWNAFDSTAFRGSVGQAFRAPTLYELYRTWVSYATTYQSNPELRPETVVTYEGGIDQHFFNNQTRFSVTGYRNDIEDLIYYRVDGNTKNRANAGKAVTKGLEFEAFQRINNWLTAWGNYTYTDSRITENDTDPNSVNKRVPGIPENTWNLGLDYEYRWINGRISGSYFSKIYNDSDNLDIEEGVYGTYEPSFTINAKVTVSPAKWMDISVSADNLLDKEYFEYYRSAGRTIFATVAFHY